MFRYGCFARTVKIHNLVEIQSGNSMSWYAKQKSQAVDYFPKGRSFRSMFFWLNSFLCVFSKCNFTTGLFSGEFFPQIFFPSTVNMGLTVTDKSVFETSFGRGRFQGNLFSFEKHKWLQNIFTWRHMFRDTS